MLKRVHMNTWERGEPRIEKIYRDIGGRKGKVSWGDLKIKRTN
jgi:hypothetical protein